jgi:hypothetical protein
MAFALSLASCAGPAVESSSRRDLSDVTSIRLVYEHSGWDHIREEFILVPASGGSDYLLTDRSEDSEGDHGNELRVPGDAVQKLVIAVTSPVWSREKGVRAVASSVKGNRAVAIEPGVSIPPGPCTPDQLKRLARAHLKRKGVAALIDEHYGQGNSWTDDYPHAQLQILFRNDPPLRMYSDSQKLMMLPWYRGIPMNSPPSSDQNWSLALSQALQGVLPEDSSFHERLGGSKQLIFLKLELELRAGKECDEMRSIGTRP